MCKWISIFKNTAQNVKVQRAINIDHMSDEKKCPVVFQRHVWRPKHPLKIFQRVIPRIHFPCIFLFQQIFRQQKVRKATTGKQEKSEKLPSQQKIFKVIRRIKKRREITTKLTSFRLNKVKQLLKQNLPNKTLSFILHLKCIIFLAC